MHHHAALLGMRGNSRASPSAGTRGNGRAPSSATSSSRDAASNRDRQAEPVLLGQADDEEYNASSLLALKLLTLVSESAV